MKIKLSAIALLAMIVPGQARAAMLTDAEATFLDQLVTAAAVLEQRCTGYAYDAAIKAHHGQNYDPDKFRLEVSEAVGKTSGQLQAALIKNPTEACADYGDSSVARGLLRRY